MAKFGFQELPISSDNVSRNNVKSTDLLILRISVSENGHDFHPEEAKALRNEKRGTNK